MWLLALFFVHGVSAQVVPPLAQVAEPPAAHVRSFAGADALAAYLRYDAPAGPLVSAHRGGPAPGFPENALPTFARALHYAPALIETDVRMTRDSLLVLLHDETLDRTTTGSGAVSDHTLAELRTLHLIDEADRVTPFRVPTLAAALSWAEGRAVLQLDVKSGVPPERVVEAVRRAGAEGRVILIAYTLESLRRYHALAPDLVLSAPAATPEAVRALLRSDVDPSRLVGFTGVGAVQPELIARLHAHNIRAILGTFCEIDERARREGPGVYEALLARGVDILATDLVPVAAQAVQRYQQGGNGE